LIILYPSREYALMNGRFSDYWETILGEEWIPQRGELSSRITV
jgi:hypothetical protein